MKKLLFFFFILVFISPLIAQAKMRESVPSGEDDIDQAYQYAKKGIYWALSNIPESKSKISNDLVADNKLYAKVKLNKLVDGIKIESTGYSNSNEVMIKIYKSNDSLIEEGYLEKNKKAVIPTHKKK
ncbi:MAG: hypothetical protein ACYCVH_13675 [Ignavibacteriaceae bacterium]